MPLEKIKLHNKLLTKVAVDFLGPSVNEGVNFEKFKGNVKSYFDNPRQRNLSHAQEYFKELEAKGELKPGKYDVLIELVEDIDNEIVELIDEAKRKIEKLDEGGGDLIDEKSRKVETRSSSNKSPRMNININTVHGNVSNYDTIHGSLTQNITSTHTENTCDGPTQSTSAGRKRRSSSTRNSRETKQLKTGGEKMRRPQDVALELGELERFFLDNWKMSIGIIEYTGSSGTGFRVGTKYIMTAFHVMKKNVDDTKRAIIARIQDDENIGEYWEHLREALAIQPTESMESVEQEVDIVLSKWMDNSRPVLNIDSLLSYLESAKLKCTAGSLKRTLERLWSRSCSIELGKLGSISNGTKYRFSYNLPFYDENADIIVLELDQSNQSFPKPFKLNRKATADEVHIVGYPSSHKKSVIFDPRCRVINNEDSEQKTLVDIKEALKYWEKASSSKRFREIRYQYEEIDLSRHQEFPFFHCSQSTTHGASGSPGITLKTEQEWPTAELIYTTAYPRAAYHEVDYSKVPPQYLVEMGVSTGHIYSILNEEIRKDDQNTKGLKDLQRDIFHNRLETDMEQM